MMTTIAFDGRCIAWDGLTTSDHQIIDKDYVKCVFKNGHAFAIAGNMTVFENLIKWYLKGAMADEFPQFGNVDSTFIVINKSLKVKLYTTGNGHYASTYIAPMAIGTGQPFAITALKAGANAKKAVKLACEIDIWSGGKITSMDLVKKFANENKKRNVKKRGK